jgi:hypothetical protein
MKNIDHIKVKQRFEHWLASNSTIQDAAGILIADSVLSWFASLWGGAVWRKVDNPDLGDFAILVWCAGPPAAASLTIAICCIWAILLHLQED